MRAAVCVVLFAVGCGGCGGSNAFVAEITTDGDGGVHGAVADPDAGDPLDATVPADAAPSPPPDAGASDAASAPEASVPLPDASSGAVDSGGGAPDAGGVSPPVDSGVDSGHVCVPLTACPPAPDDAGTRCPNYPDGCGGLVACPPCVLPYLCGGSGVENVCGCPHPAPNGACF